MKNRGVEGDVERSDPKQPGAILYAEQAGQPRSGPPESQEQREAGEPAKVTAVVSTRRSRSAASAASLVTAWEQTEAPNQLDREKNRVDDAVNAKPAGASPRASNTAIT